MSTTQTNALPEFVLKHIEQVLEMEILDRDQIKLAKLFCFPHDPPQVGDERLVVEMWPISRDEHKKGGA